MRSDLALPLRPKKVSASDANTLVSDVRLTTFVNIPSICLNFSPRSPYAALPSKTA